MCQAFAAKYWVQLGAPPEKLNIGLALYGRSFTLKNAADHGVGSPAKGGGKAGKFTQEEGYLSFYEVLAFTWQYLFVPTVNLFRSESDDLKFHLLWGFLQNCSSTFKNKSNTVGKLIQPVERRIKDIPFECSLYHIAWRMRLANYTPSTNYKNLTTMSSEPPLGLI
jgi:hypothetical protein